MWRAPATSQNVPAKFTLLLTLKQLPLTGFVMLCATTTGTEAVAEFPQASVAVTVTV